MATITGTAGNDTVTPGGVSAGVNGSIPGAGADSISGLDGNDLLSGGAGQNTVLGGLGDDTIFAAGLGESLDGGGGTDTYAYAGSEWIVVDLQLEFASKGSVLDTVPGFERAFAGNGNDTVKGGLGADTLGGGRGNDLIDGRAGLDLADYGTSYTGAPTAGAVVNLSSGTVTMGTTAYAAGTARDGWGGTDTLLNIEGAIGTDLNDTLIGRSDAASRLEGGAGGDSLVGGNGANTLLGGAGNDTITFGGYAESLLGGADLDTLVYRGAHALVIDLGTEVTATEGYKGFISDFSVLTDIYGFERAYASTGSDTIKGTNGDDTIGGDAGNNQIDGRAGFDTADYGTAAVSAINAGVFANLSAGTQTAGGVTLAAGTARTPWSGTDTLAGIEGVIGTAFADTVIGSNLDNAVSGGDGADSLNGSGGNDTLLGGAGDDTLRGGDGSDSIDGGAGNDSILGGLGSDVIEGGEATARNSLDYRASTSGYSGGALNLLFTGATAATVTKADGADTVRNINQVYGTAAADSFNLAAVSATAPWTVVVRGGAGNDTITGNGTDRVVADYNGTTGAISVNLAAGTALDGEGGSDSLVNVRAVLSSLGGNDTLTGSAGDDTFIISGAGNKILVGGGGHDTWRYQGSANATVDLGTSNAGGAYVGYATHGSGGTDGLTGFDRAYGGLGADTIRGTNGSDTLGGDYGADRIDGRSGSDIVDYSAFSTRPITAGVFVNLSNGSQTADTYPLDAGGVTTVTLAAGTARDSWGFTDSFGNETLPGVSNLEGAIGTDFADALFGTNFADLFIGNGGDDSISSGGGSDTVRGGAGDDSIRGGDGNDRIDGGAGWDIASVNVASKDAAWSRNAATGAWTVTATAAASAEGTDTLTSIEALRFTDRRLDFAKAFADDVSGDGVSDILWRDADGGLAYWAMQGLGGSGVSLPGVSTAWTLLGAADLNGDGWSDLVWRHSSGALSTWYSGGTGFSGGGGTIATVDTAWKVAAIGDMNRDGRADILWRHTDGSVAVWQMDGTAVTGGGGIGSVDTSWSILGLADLNGDGRSDIVWRNADGTVAAWLMDGTRAIGGTIYNPGAAWKVAGMGDFNGDGNADLLWRNDDGSVVLWTMDGVAVKATGSLGNPGTAWTVAKVADYNGDGMVDILWHNADGSVALWLMNGLTALSTGSLGNAGSWMVV